MKSVFFKFDPLLLNENFIDSVVCRMPQAEFCLEKLVGMKTFPVLVKVFLPYFAIYCDTRERPDLIDLNQQVFEPFQQEEENFIRYGFYLNDLTFFVKAEDVILNVFELVKGFCSLTWIQETMAFIKVIEEGTTAKVFLAESLDKRNKFAVKRIEKKVQVNTEIVFNEINILKKLDHPRICKLLSKYEDKKYIYLVFEYISSFTLAHHLAKEKVLSEKMCKSLISSLLETLSYIHSIGIIHRDLKLEHILVNLENPLEFKILDFGIACDSTQTKRKKCGSPGYIAPEVLRSEDYGTKIDIFSVGVILYTLLHGNFPFNANNLKAVLNQNKICSFKVSKKVSKEVKVLIQDMMNPIPSLRPSASEILEHSWFGRLKDIRSPCSNVTTPYN